MAPANDDTPKADPNAKIDLSATKDEGQVTRVSATEQEQRDTYRGLSSKVERQELSDFNLWHTIAVREGLAVENDTINEKVRHAYKGEGKDKKEVGQWNYAESKGWIETSEAKLQDRDVLTEAHAKNGDLQAQERLVKGSEDASSEGPESGRSPFASGRSSQSRPLNPALS